MAITITSDSATIDVAGRFLASDSAIGTYQTTDCVLQVFLDLSALQAGDTFIVNFYEAVNGGTSRVFATTTFAGVQSPANWCSSQYLVGEGWEVTLAKTGGTDRVIPWSLRTVA